MEAMDNLHTLTISNALDLIRGQKISPQDLAAACFRQIERLNPELKAFITVCDSQAPANPQPSGQTIPVALANALRGIPIAVKDLFDTAGIRTTAGSKFFADNIPDTDAFVVEKLKQAGAIIMGKTNTHEIALGVTGNNPHYGTARNPWDVTRIPGGSSSGSAIATTRVSSLRRIWKNCATSSTLPRDVLLCRKAGPG